jgi:hypothetical protein
VHAFHLHLGDRREVGARKSISHRFVPCSEPLEGPYRKPLDDLHRKPLAGCASDLPDMGFVGSHDSLSSSTDGTFDDGHVDDVAVHGSSGELADVLFYDWYGVRSRPLTATIDCSGNRAGRLIAMGRREDPPGAAKGVTGGTSSVSGHVEAQSWLGGLDDTKLVDGAIDKETNNLHAAVGQACPQCGHVITQDQIVRRMVSGAYKHDSC